MAESLMANEIPLTSKHETEDGKNSPMKFSKGSKEDVLKHSDLISRKYEIKKGPIYKSLANRAQNISSGSMN